MIKPPSCKRALASGFTLIELSIVLVILGLIAGGIMVGREMVRSSELNSIVTDRQKYISAMNNFKTQYLGMPGDIRNATQFWGNNCSSTAVGTETCNGNGDGKIDGRPAFAGDAYERFTAIKQLQNAKLIEGSYTGRTAGGTNRQLPGVNVPETKIAGVGVTFLYFDVPNDYAAYGLFDGLYGHVMVFGRGREAPDVHIGTALPAFTAAEVMGIDSKIDDGRPGFGIVMALEKNSVYARDCSTTNDANTAVYDVSRATQECSIIMKMGM